MIANDKRLLVAALFGAQLLLLACSGGDGGEDGSVDAFGGDQTVDISTDLGSSPCSAGVTVQKVFDGKMAVCDNGDAIPITQCLAETLCNADAGWRLCTASEYQARADSRGSPVEAWIQGCVRDSNDAPTAPSDTLCTCERVIGTEAYDMSWSCTGVPLHKNVRQWHIALIADKLCHRVGVDEESTEGMWNTLASYTLRSAAVCCR